MPPPLDPHPLVIAWNQYVDDHDVEQLLAVATQDLDQPNAMRFILWMALGAGDWRLVRMSGELGITLPPEKESGYGFLFDALSEFGDVPNTIEWLINHGARIDARGPNDWTPLHLASHSGWIDSVRTLVKLGANVNSQTAVDGGNTPLMEACASGHLEVVQFLLTSGADSKVRNSWSGSTAQEIAIQQGL